MPCITTSVISSSERKMKKKYFVKITQVNQWGNETIEEIGPVDWKRAKELLDATDSLVENYLHTRFLERERKYRKLMLQGGRSYRIVEARETH